MPVLNSRGDVLAGVGGHQGSLNRVPFPFPSYGGACWLDDDTVLVSIPAPTAQGSILATWRPGAASATPLPDQRGANDYAAGGGRFIAWLAGYGVWGSLGHLPAAGLPNSGTGFASRCVAPDGTIAYIPDRGNGYGLDVVSPDGLVSEAPGIWSLDEQTLGGDRAAVWRGGALNTPIPKPARPAFNTQVVDLPDGERWLVYWADGVGFVAQLDGALDGYIFGTEPVFYNHSARAVDGELWITWSSTSGEGPNDVTVLRVDRAQPRVALVPPPVAIPTFSFTHPVFVAPFKDPYGATAAPAEIVVNQTGQQLDRPCFVAEDSLDWRGALEGIYSEAPDPAAVLAVAAAHETRLMLAHDSIADWPVPAGLRPWDLPTLELYLSEGESLDQSVARWTRQVDQLLAEWAGSIGVIPMFYCMGGAPPDELFTVDQVLAGLHHLSAIVNRSPRIVVIAPFSYLRANGIDGHVELQQAFENLLAEQRRVGLATLPPIAQPEPPEPEPPEPEPPEPEPEPEPEPPQPEVPAMLFIETKYEKTNPTLAVMKFEIIANPDGSESYRSVARAASADADEKNTPIYCVTDQGKDEWRTDPGGAFESFRRVGNVLVADRLWNGIENAYTRFCVEVKS